jgi:hypothetical protein
MSWGVYDAKRSVAKAHRVTIVHTPAYWWHLQRQVRVTHRSGELVAVLIQVSIALMDRGAYAVCVANPLRAHAMVKVPVGQRVQHHLQTVLLYVLRDKLLFKWRDSPTVNNHTLLSVIADNVAVLCQIITFYLFYSYHIVELTN